MGCKVSKEQPPQKGQSQPVPSSVSAPGVAGSLAAADAEHAAAPLPAAAASPAADADASLGGSPTRRRTSLERAEFSAIKGGNTRRTSLGNQPQHLKVGFQVDEHAPSAEQHDRRSSKTFHASADAVSMSKIVQLFYQRVLHDPELAPFFEAIDMEALNSKMEYMFNLAFGGRELANEEGGKDLRAVHARLIAEKGLNQAHWDRFYGHLRETLESLPAIPQEKRELALQQLAPTRQYFGPPS